MAMSGAGFGVVGDADVLIVEMLDEAVPMLMGELAELVDDDRYERMTAWRETTAQTITERGDVVRFGGRKPGDVAPVFSALARGLAALAFCPGGVTFMQRHWCADHGVCDQAAAEAEREVSCRG